MPLQKIDKHGYATMEQIVNNLSWKVQPHELTFDVMLCDAI